MKDFGERKISRLLRGIHSGAVNPHALPTDLYTATATHLMSGAYEGFGFDITTAKGKNLVKLLDIRENLYVFSGAKTYTQTSDMMGLLKDAEGKTKSFSKFKNDVMPMYEQYNVDWLKSEYNTAIGQSQIVEQWQYIQETKEQLPLLMYDAIEDLATSPICRPLNGIVLPVDHPFWRRFAPLNHFNCRCVLRQLGKGEATPTRAKQLGVAVKEAGDKITPLFEHNAGISAQIFTKQHPYFDVPASDKAFARKNFNLPIPGKD